MITRLYLDNYKCFVNFEWRPTNLQLMLGSNGSGKTTVFDVLETLREFIVSGTPVSEAFPTKNLTAWDTRGEQTFELEIKGNGGLYRYRLVVEHDRQKQKSRVKDEQLLFNDGPLYKFDGTDAHLYRDDGSSGPAFPFDWSRSAIATIPERDENQRLTWFRKRVGKVYIFSPDPLRMTSRSETELDKPDRQLHDFVSWLRHLWQQQSLDTSSALRNNLREGALEGFCDWYLDSVSENARVLRLAFDFSEDGAGKPGTRFKLAFDELSDGQRCLVVLYTMLTLLRSDVTLCLDEADNFVALREIQPWLRQLYDRVEDGDSQCLLVSHNPEPINYLAAQHGQIFFRDAAGPVRVKPFEWTKDDVIAPSEVVARGWE